MTLTAPGVDDVAAEIRGDHQGAVNAKKTQFRIEQQARAELAAENASRPPAAFNGADFLAQADDEITYRIAKLWPAGGNVVLAAQYKTGKTTLVHNLIRVLCDGTPFLGSYHTEPPGGGIFVLDTEMPSSSTRRWLREQSVKDPSRFTYQNLRGAASSFDLLVPAIRQRWAHRIAGTGAAVVILDCLGPVLAGLGLDENSNTDVGRFLGAFAELLAEAGTAESVVVHHLGHAGERTRGGSKLRDWPDAEWRLLRADNNDPASARFFSAFGRDVDVPESKLEHDSSTRHVRIAGGTRAAAKTVAAVDDIVKTVKATPGINTRTLYSAAEKAGYPQHVVRDALAVALDEGLVIRREGTGRALLHYPAGDPGAPEPLPLPFPVANGKPRPGQAGDPVVLASRDPAAPEVRPPCEHGPCWDALLGACLEPGWPEGSAGEAVNPDGGGSS